MVGELIDTGTLAGLRDRALLLLGFGAALRRSELVALDAEDLCFDTVRGLLVTIRRSKTDQLQQGELVAVPFAQDPDRCAVRCVRCYLDAAGIEGGPVFRQMRRGDNLTDRRLSDQSVALVVKRRAEAAGVSAVLLSGHSLRAGYATAAAAAGVEERKIANVTRHRSLPVLRGYIRTATAFDDVGEVLQRQGLPNRPIAAGGKESLSLASNHKMRVLCDLEETPISFTWTPITPDEELGGDHAPGPDELRFDERWVALVLLAKQTNTGTRAGYRRDINTFMRWWHETRPAQLSATSRPLEASKSDIQQYAAWLADLEPPLAAATRARRLAVVSSFYALAEEHELVHRTPLRGVRRPTVENEDAHLGLDADQADELLYAAETWPDRQEGTLVALLLLCGLRISEALGIRARDITTRERGRKAEIRIRRKGRDHRTVFHVDDERLADRLAALKASTVDDRPVFDLDRFQAGRTLARIGRQAGINPPPHPHILRHTFCAHLLQAGLDVREVQRLAGHRDLRTTQRYVDALNRADRPVSSLLRQVFSEIHDELDSAA